MNLPAMERQQRAQVKKMLSVGGAALVRRNRDAIKNNVAQHPLPHGRAMNKKLLSAFEAAMKFHGVPS